MNYSGRDLNDTTGWVATDCDTSDEIRDTHEVTKSDQLLDISGDFNFGKHLIYTEWKDAKTGALLLRDYSNFPDSAKASTCSHWIPEMIS